MSNKVKFNQRAKHGIHDFARFGVYEFEDEDAGPYFIACGWADPAGDAAEVDVFVTLGELDIDPLTVWADAGAKRGKFVMPERAAQALRDKGHDVTDEWARDYVATFVSSEEIFNSMESLTNG